MTDPRYKKLAALLVNYSTALKKGDRILIELVDVPDAFAVELIRAVAAQRIVKGPEEIAEMERAVAASVAMHRAAALAARIAEKALTSGVPPGVPQGAGATALTAGSPDSARSASIFSAILRRSSSASLLSPARMADSYAKPSEERLLSMSRSVGG